LIREIPFLLENKVKILRTEIVLNIYSHIDIRLDVTIMAKKRPREEAKYYDSVLYWLSKQGYYVGQHMTKGETEETYWYKNLGARARADVAGVKNVGNKLIDKVEIAVVEVKDRPIKLRSIEQAYGYSIYAHKCYLATTYEIDEENKSLAHNFGIGLLEINPRKSKKINFFGTSIDCYRVKEILSPKLMEPNEAEMLKFLSILSVVKCTICGCYVFYWKGPTVKKFYRGKQFSIMTETSEYPFGKPPRGYRIRRYICQDCQEQLTRLLKLK